MNHNVTLESVTDIIVIKDMKNMLNYDIKKQATRTLNCSKQLVLFAYIKLQLFLFYYLIKLLPIILNFTILLS